MSLELADYRLGDARSLTREKLLGDQSVSQDEFAQVIDTTSIEVHHEGEKFFALATYEVDEVKPHMGEDVHYVPYAVKVFEKVKAESDLIMHGQQ
ncbi:hypothetical protein AMTRI_Chr11g155940 [Amborella trichopoda]